MVDFRNKYKRNKTFIITTCIMCGEEMLIPKSYEKDIKCCSEECSNRKNTLSKMKGKYVLCHMCDKAIWISPKKYKNKHHFCSKECDTKYRGTVDSLNNKKVITGKKKYYGENWNRQRRKARKRDDYTCQNCGITEELYGQELSVHHIKPFVMFDNYKEANSLSNLISVCEPCHRKIHSGDNHPYKFDKSNIKNEEIILNGGVLIEQELIAKEIVSLLLNTDLTLSEISKRVKCSTTRVYRIYHGDRWNNLYETPPYITNPRAKSRFIKR